MLGKHSDSQLLNMAREMDDLCQEHAGDIVVDDAMAIEEPDEPALDDEAWSRSRHGCWMKIVDAAF